MKMLKFSLVALGAAFALAAHAAPADADRAATEAIVHDYLLAHPEIIPEALHVLETRDLTKAINANRKALETPFGAESDGNPNGDVTLVEFFDYNCGYCRASLPDLKRLLAEDKNLRVVYREIPVLGSDSDAAAIVSLAVAKQDKNWTRFHHAVYAADEATAANVSKAQRLSGVVQPSTAALKAPELREEINRNLTLAQTLKVTGTPSWVVGDQMLSGAVGYDALKAAISQARAKAAH